MQIAPVVGRASAPCTARRVGIDSSGSRRPASGGHADRQCLQARRKGGANNNNNSLACRRPPHHHPHSIRFGCRRLDLTPGQTTPGDNAPRTWAAGLHPEPSAPFLLCLARPIISASISLLWGAQHVQSKADSARGVREGEALSVATLAIERSCTVPGARSVGALFPPPAHTGEKLLPHEPRVQSALGEGRWSGVAEEPGGLASAR